MHEEPIHHLDRRLGGPQLDLNSIKRKKIFSLAESEKLSME
jgi:hypothetical protein